MSKNLLDRFDLTGKTALITGGGSGMGKEFARILAEAGATVMIAARDEERLQKSALEIASETNSTIRHRHVDLTDRNQAAALVLHAQEVMGGLDILVCNAAMFLNSSADNFVDEDYDKLLSVNFTSNIWMTRAAIPEMKRKKWGRIIYITSVTSQLSLKNTKIGIYAASKAALEGYARFVAAELGTQGITVNCLAPGAVKVERSGTATEHSSVSKKQIEERLAYTASLNSINRFGMPHEIAPALLLLASEAGSYITGTRYLVDGGWATLGDTVA